MTLIYRVLRPPEFSIGNAVDQRPEHFRLVAFLDIAENNSADERNQLPFALTSKLERDMAEMQSKASMLQTKPAATDPPHPV